jgi:palmitoyltransferase ZDHHC13/17
MLPKPTEFNCALLKDEFCAEYSKDPLTIITNAWASLQLTWTFMLLFVHLTQVARNITTFETMKGQGQVGPLMSVVTTGTTSATDAQIDAAGAGPQSGPHAGHQHGHAKKKEGFLTQWSRLLGLDTFFTIAFQGYKASQATDDPSSSASRRSNKNENPFSRGIFRNCQDFWSDGPIFGIKDSGKARLGGEVVDYTAMYDVPKGGMRYRSGGYESVPAAEEGEV